MAIYMWREYVMPDYLCFTANTAGSTVKLNKNYTPTSVNLETSTDGNTWSNYTFGNTITLSNVGDKIYWRNASETTTGFNLGFSNEYQFVMTGSIAASGDIMYLVNKNSTTEFYNGSTDDWGLCNLFNGCTSLTTTPKLPATVLCDRAYYNMFRGCTNLETLPKLIATTLTQYCYNCMFYGCTKIKVSTTQTGEYQTEFRIPESGTGTIASSALNNMFNGTGGTFTGTPTINTTYYTSNQVI